jgi:hypothetical protein
MALVMESLLQSLGQLLCYSGSPPAPAIPIAPDFSLRRCKADLPAAHGVPKFPSSLSLASAFHTGSIERRGWAHRLASPPAPPRSRGIMMIRLVARMRTKRQSRTLAWKTWADCAHALIASVNGRNLIEEPQLAPAACAKLNATQKIPQAPAPLKTPKNGKKSQRRRPPDQIKRLSCSRLGRRRAHTTSLFRSSVKNSLP